MRSPIALSFFFYYLLHHVYSVTDEHVSLRVSAHLSFTV